MQAKLFELRDRATFIPVLAVRLTPETEEDEYLLRRSSFGPDPSQHVILTGLAGGQDKSTCDPYDWGVNRTRLYSHEYIIKHFDELPSGAVIDVEYILGESPTPKLSERLDT